jgi:hypothetical protein
VFIWRRDTDRSLVALLGGRLFPGVHGHATFDVSEAPDRLRYSIRTDDDRAHVGLAVAVVDAWQSTELFPTFDDVVRFFERGDRGFSCSLRGDRLEGMRLRSLTWRMVPLAVQDVESAFYDATDRFPTGTIGLDGAVLMRDVPHEWHGLNDVPELAGTWG